MADYDSDDSENSAGPVELPDGRLVCRSHGWVVCGRCCVDYSFMDDVLETEEDAEARMEREAEEPYELLSPERKAIIDARWGPPTLRRATDTESREPAQSSGQSRDGEGLSLPFIYRQPDSKSLCRGTGRVFPTEFEPPSSASIPEELFLANIGNEAIPAIVRFIRHDNSQQFLIYTDGACRANGQANPRAGWAAFFKPETNQPAGIVSGRLEQMGPFGDEQSQTSNRAELRAVIGALRFRAWYGEGFKTIVIATDSEYVAKGATAWTRTWVRNGWKTTKGADVKNVDLWQALLGESERLGDRGLDIQIWRIPRGLNAVADRAAKQAADDKPDQPHFFDINGFLI